MASTEIRVFLADDHNLVRSGLTNLLENTPGMYVVGEAANGQELIDKYFECQPDVVVCDIYMPVLSGIEAAEFIKGRDENAKILFLTIYDSEEYLYRAVKAGAAGFINKSITKGELRLAIKTVFNSQKYFGKNYTDERINEILKKYDSEYPPMSKLSKKVVLSQRELTILKMVCDGSCSNDIAKELTLSKKTIDSYRSSIMKKFNVNNTSQLIKSAFINKILE
ncbi:MAG: response regulator [Bacillota bacterium]